MRTQLATFFCLITLFATPLIQAEPESVSSSEFVDTELPNLFEIRQLLDGRNFQKLHETLHAIQTSFERGVGSDIDVEIAYLAFASLEPTHEQILNEWVDVHPESYTALMARAAYWGALAMAHRGVDYVSQTSDTQFQAMHEAQAIAIRDLETVVTLNPKMTVAYADMIAIGATGGHRELLRRGFEDGLLADPASYVVRKAMLSFRIPRWGGSYSEMESLLAEMQPYVVQNRDLGALNGFVDYAKALDMISAGKLREAITFSTAALEHGNKGYYYERRADTYFRLDNFEAAVADYNNAIQVYPYSADAYLWRGLAHKHLGNQQESMKDLHNAAELAPYDHAIRLALGNALRKAGRYEETVESYYAALEYKRDDDNLWYYTGWYLSHKLKRHKDAADALSHATRLAPENPSYWYETAVALSALKDCKVTNAMDTYLGLCDEGGSCEADQVQWAMNTVSYLKSTHCKSL